LGVATISFVISRIIPGNPAEMMAGEQAPPEVIEAIKEAMGIDKPLHIQYLRYMGQLLRGDLGYAWHTQHDVIDDLLNRLPATVELTFASMLFVLLGVFIGVYSATHRGGILDQIGRLFSLIGVSLPTFWFGLLLLLVFYTNLGWAPPPLGRISVYIDPPTRITGLYILDSIITLNWRALVNSIHHILLPAICLTSGSLASITRVTRSSMLEVLQADYITTARVKGIRETIVIWKHALRNALLPVTTLGGLQIGYLLGGAVLTETIFAWPGIGKYAVDSILWLDYAPVQGFMIFSAFVFSIVNLVVDILYYVLDPRIRYD
jgi:peptide/nickel transport system permease protein